MSPVQWPSSREYVEAIQNPRLAFQDPDLKASASAVDRLGMPFVTSGQFAYVFKMNSGSGEKAQAVRCFRGVVGDRERRYQCINDHLNKVSAPYFASFEYDPQGIMVGGRRYPIQVMEWITGFPLDVYLPNVLGREDVLKFIADLWLKALASLRDGGMAHGDLQHGNVIVDASNSLRLVDLDGMFVPKMAGWQASELGHRHYQHPRRGPKDFDARLDNFSGLVIYISLLSLMHKPDLWGEYHDENLIFTKADFDNPRASKLFAKVKAIGPEHQRLADALEKACGTDPLQCPCVLDLVGTKPSKLPAWMIAGPTVTVAQTTREVKPGDAPPVFSPSAAMGAKTSVRQPFPTQILQPSVPSAGASSASPASALQTSPAPPFTTLLIPSAQHALNYAFMGVFLVLLWFPVLRALFISLGAESVDASLLTAASFLATCGLLGYRKARALSSLALPAVTATPVLIQPQPVASTPFPNIASSRSSPRPAIPLPASTPASSPQMPCVGSKIRLVYHRLNCTWANKISYRNRVQFRSVADARNAGYRPCSVCSP